MTAADRPAKEKLTRNDLTAQGMASLAHWLSYCENIGWLPEQMADLEAVWLKFKDKDGNLR